MPEVKNPSCPSCEQSLDADGIQGVNYCRALFLLPFIEAAPGLTGWELSQRSGLSYGATVRGTQRLRDRDAVVAEAEDRDQGGIRFRYFPAAADAITKFQVIHDAATRRLWTTPSAS